jgi:hypothetical protein
MKKKVLFGILLIGLMLLAFWAGKSCERFESDLNDLGKPTFEKLVIHFPRHNTWLYFKSKTWGIAGNHKVSVLSASDEFAFEPNAQTDFIFEDFKKIIYRTTPDSLILYMPHTFVKPLDFQSPIFIQVLELNTMEYLELAKKEEQGLHVFQ